MNKKVMDALEAVADEANFQKPVDGMVEVDKDNLDILIAWAMGQRIHLQYGEEVGLKVYEGEDEEGLSEAEKQSTKGTIVGFSGRDGVIVATDYSDHMYYERSDVRTL